MQCGAQRVRVYADIVGDLFHWGHVRFLERARQLGSELWVGVHGDEDVAAFKRRPVMGHEERCTVIEACRHVDRVLPLAPLVITDELLDTHEIDLVVHGDDFSPQVLEMVYGVPLRRGILRTLAYSPGISTTEIITRLRERDDEATPEVSASSPALDALRASRTPSQSAQR